MQVYNDELYHGCTGITIKDENNELYHHGVPGMKWGHRIKQNIQTSIENRNSEIKTNVKAYKKQFDKASNMSDKADSEWNKTKSMYKKTGKNRVAAIINNVKNKSPEVKAYKKQFDKASNMSDKADSEWNKTKSMYKKTGKNRVAAIINNIKY